MSRVVVGMSGGVDSSVAAYLLKREGYDVIGVTMQISAEEGRDPCDAGGCCGLSAAEDARRVCDIIGIPFYALNFKAAFQTHVVDYFIGEYKKGRTPNPCIACNRYVKWEALFGQAMSIGADYIATGHYARLRRLPNGRLTLQTAADGRKDQTYALYSLTQAQLAKTLLPIGGYEKPAIRRIAAELNLPVASKPDSQEICFVPNDDYAAYLETRLGAGFGAGDFTDTHGRVIGKHGGYYKYTVGQRKGLGTAFGKRVYVTAVNPETRAVTLGEDADLYVSDIYAANVSYMAIETLTAPTQARAKLRYNQPAAPCLISPHNGGLLCAFDKPQRAAAPGQALVCYDDYSNVLCGGTIERSNAQ